MTTPVEEKPTALQPGLLQCLPRPPRRVAVLRASRIGDFICTTPALRALRAALPDSKIAVITLPALGDIVERLPYIDQYVEFPGLPGIAEQLFEPADAISFFQRIQSEDLDLAIQMQGSGAYSNSYMLMMGGRATAGFIRRGDGPGLLDAALPLPNSGHETDRMLALVQFLGAARQGREPDFRLTAADRAEAEELLAGAARPLIGLHPASRDSRRGWPVERFAATGRQLQERAGGTLIVFAEGEHASQASTVVEAAGGRAINLAGRLSLPVLGAVIRTLDVLVTNDSGPAHIAYTLATPTVTIVGKGDSERYGPVVDGPFRLLRDRSPSEQCSHCGPGCLCLTKIRVADAVEAAVRVMRRREEAGNGATGLEVQARSVSLSSSPLRLRARKPEGRGQVVPGVRKICVLGANGIGDMVFALPALAALRKAYPRAEIVLIGQPWHAELLPGRGIVDRVVVTPPYPGVRTDSQGFASEEEVANFFRSMADEEFDLTIQMHGGGAHSNPFVSRLGARLTVGLRAAGAPPLDWTIPYLYYQDEYRRYLELVGLVGAAPVSVAPRIPVLASDLAEAGQFAPSSEPFAVLHPGATDPRRRWPAERFAVLGDWLAERGL